MSALSDDEREYLSYWCCGDRHPEKKKHSWDGKPLGQMTSEEFKEKFEEDFYEIQRDLDIMVPKDKCLYFEKHEWERAVEVNSTRQNKSVF